MTKNSRKRILVVEDDELFRETLNDFLKEKYVIQEAKSAKDALNILSKNGSELILLDINLPHGIDGIQLLAKIKARWPFLPVIMISAMERISTVVESIKHGAFDYLTKPINDQELLVTIDRALETSELRGELEQRRRLQLAADNALKLIGASSRMDKLRREILKVGGTEATVLIEGETGTGKELVAQSIHACSTRANKPYVAINCGAIPDNLMESELFGHKKGAFTGAINDGMGKFQLAHGGTLLLDEVGELTPAAQVKLLRVLEKQEFYPVGGTKLVRVDVRVIASTNKKLKELVGQGKFREDLFFRLNVYFLFVPPLRERPGDIIEIAEYFIEQYSRSSGKGSPQLSSEARELLLNHNWRGNVRELRNVIERVVLFLEGSLIKREHLKFLELISAPKLSANSIRLLEGGIDLEEVEKSLISQALKLAKYNKSKAAKLLNLSPPTLYYRLEKYGLE